MRQVAEPVEKLQPVLYMLNNSLIRDIFINTMHLARVVCSSVVEGEK